MNTDAIISKNYEFISEDKNQLLNESIIFLDFSPKYNLLLLLSSHNSLYICEIIGNSIKIKNKFESIVDNRIKISKSYFCNEEPNLILLLCDNYNILEWNVEREYISHIYYDILGDIYEFKMNYQKNSELKTDIKNFCILKDGEINVWNTMAFNKKNVLNIKDVKCFCYDSTGLLLFYIYKSSIKYNIKVIKFVDEYECKELYNKGINCFDSKTNIDYINSFDVNIIMSDTKLGKIYIFKNHPINVLEFQININNSQIYFPLIGKNPIFEFRLLCLNINENEQKIITFNYKSKKPSMEKIKLSINNLTYFKESISKKGLFLVFDDIKKELKEYQI